MENSFYRYKTILGRARTEDCRYVVTILGCKILNRFFELGHSVSKVVQTRVDLGFLVLIFLFMQQRRADVFNVYLIGIEKINSSYFYSTVKLHTASFITLRSTCRAARSGISVSKSIWSNSPLDRRVCVIESELPCADKFEKEAEPL